MPPLNPHRVFVQDIHDRAYRHAASLIGELSRLIEISEREGIPASDIRAALEHARLCRAELAADASPELVNGR